MLNDQANHGKIFLAGETQRTEPAVYQPNNTELRAGDSHQMQENVSS